MLIRIPAGKIADKVGIKTPYLIACVLPMGALLIMSQTQDILTITAAMIIYGLGWGMNAVTASTLISESVSSRAKGMAIAMDHTMFGVGNSIGSLTAGLLVSTLPESAIFQASAIFGLVGFVPALMWIKEPVH